MTGRGNGYLDVEIRNRGGRIGECHRQDIMALNKTISIRLLKLSKTFK